jgi:hypothetical protein
MRIIALSAIALLALGCAPKKLVQPIQGPATARYDVFIQAEERRKQLAKQRKKK